MNKQLNEQAILKRVNRKLAHKLERLSKRRSGEYHYIDVQCNAILAYPVDLESFARELGVLASGEKVA